MLKKYLSDKNISIYNLSKKSKIPYTTLNEFVNGAIDLNQVSINTYDKVSKALGISIDKLYKICTNREEINKEFYYCFWDSDPSKLDLIKNKNYIIGRLLDKGDIKAFNYVFNNYTKKELIEFTKKSRNMNKKIANFLSIYFNVDKKDMMFYKTSGTDWR